MHRQQDPDCGLAKVEVVDTERPRSSSTLGERDRPPDFAGVPENLAALHDDPVDVPAVRRAARAQPREHRGLKLKVHGLVEA